MAERLAAAGCVAADEEAAELVGAAPDPATLAAWVARREGGEPLAWITGSLVFCGRPVAVGPGVYVPRLQTEGLARRAAGLLPAGGRAVDLCTGAGPVAAHLATAVPGASVVGVDVDALAVAWARRNGVAAVRADVAQAPLRDGAADVVTAVPPYVPTRAMGLLPRDVVRHEPAPALDGGADGLDVVRRVVAAAARLLRPGGWLLVEVGADQDRSLAPALARSGFGPAATWADGDGDLRGLATCLDA